MAQNRIRAVPVCHPYLGREALDCSRPGQASGKRFGPPFSFAEVLRFTAPGRRAAAELIGAGAAEEVLGARVGGEISATSLEVVAG